MRRSQVAQRRQKCRTGQARAPFLVCFLLEFDFVLFYSVDGRVSQGGVNEEAAVINALVDCQHRVFELNIAPVWHGVEHLSHCRNIRARVFDELSPF